MVSIAVSKMGMTELIFVVPGMKVNGQYYRDALLSQHTVKIRLQKGVGKTYLG